MREIKFRALLKDGSGWRYGVFPYVAPEISNSIYPMFKFWEQFRSLYQRHTLTQFTGLKDKNGKEIYKGDIITSPDCLEEGSYEICEVYWNLKDVEWAAKSNEYDDNLSAFTDDCEVIGNIYENHELIKSNKKEITQ